MKRPKIGPFTAVEQRGADVVNESALVIELRHQVDALEVAHATEKKRWNNLVLEVKESLDLTVARLEEARAKARHEENEKLRLLKWLTATGLMDEYESWTRLSDQ